MTQADEPPTSVSLTSLIVSTVVAAALVAFAMFVTNAVAAANPVRLDSLTPVETLRLLGKLFGVPLGLLFAAIGVLYRLNRPAVEPTDALEGPKFSVTDLG